MFGLAAVAFAAHSMCQQNGDKTKKSYQIALLMAFCGVLCAFCGIVMMGSGLGVHLFTGGATPTRGMGGGGGYGMGGYGMGGLGGGYY
jgi:predicted signal transduction protein with EAL and GGDEF domain